MSKKISQLPAAGALTGSELVEAVQAGINVQTTAQDIADLGGGGGAVSSVFSRTGAVTGQAGDYTATQITNTPAGGIAATTVQAAINELDTEKQAALGFTAENVANKATGFGTLNNTLYPTTQAVSDRITAQSPKVLVIACSDEVTPITAATNKVKFRMPYAMTVTAVRASLSTTQTSGSIFTVDINDSGTTILSTKLTIDNGETTSTTAATPPVISDTALADDAEISIDVDQIGDNTAKGLKVTLIGS